MSGVYFSNRTTPGFLGSIHGRKRSQTANSRSWARKSLLSWSYFGPIYLRPGQIVHWAFRTETRLLGNIGVVLAFPLLAQTRKRTEYVTSGIFPTTY